MDVFLSWSKSPSKEYAEIFHKNIPVILQHVNTFLSNHSIEKGSVGTEVIYDNLSDTGVGLLFMTPNNISEQWINFEAGALFKGKKKNRVIPLLFDGCEKSLTGPIRNLQYSEYNKESVYDALLSINNNSGSEKLDENKLRQSFDIFWKEIEAEIQAVSFEYDENDLIVDEVEVKFDRILNELSNIKKIEDDEKMKSLPSNFSVGMLKKAIEFSEDYLKHNKIEIESKEVDKKLITEVKRKFPDYRLSNQIVVYNIVKMNYILNKEESIESITPFE